MAAPDFRDERRDHVLKDFGGVNTQAGRTAIEENEFSWLENLMPVGHANLRAVPLQSSALATIPNVSINYFKYVNINNTDYLIAATVGGGMYAINLSTFSITTVLPNGTLLGQSAVEQWKSERILIISGSNYWGWDGTTLTILGGTTGAPSAGQTIVAFSGRVWISSGRTVLFSAPNSYSDFTTASAGGSLIITDSVLHGNITQMLAANNYLYIIGSSAINVVSDVRTSGSPAVTLFSNTNISANIGSPFPLSVFVHMRDIMFATNVGFYALRGTTPYKISDKLDGVFPLFNLSNAVSGGEASIFNILCPAFLLTYNDPVVGARQLMALNFNGKWFFASQGSTRLICAVLIGGVPALFGTDGTNIYRLFFDAVSPISTTLSTALWHFNAPTREKQAIKVGVELTIPAQSSAFNVTVDNNSTTGIPQTLTGSNLGQWYNSANVLGNWINSLGVQGGWLASGFFIYQADAQSSYGRYLGFTMTSSTPAYSINGLALQYASRGQWNAS